MHNNSKRVWNKQIVQGLFAMHQSNAFWNILSHGEVWTVSFQIWGIHGHCHIWKQRSGCGIMARWRPSGEHRAAAPPEIVSQKCDKVQQNRVHINPWVSFAGRLLEWVAHPPVTGSGYGKKRSRDLRGHHTSWVTNLGGYEPQESSDLRGHEPQGSLNLGGHEPQGSRNLRGHGTTDRHRAIIRTNTA